MKLTKPFFWNNNFFNIFALILLPISILIQLLFFLKKNFTVEKNFKLRTICVGNLYLGGTGKTPLTVKLSDIFNKKKIKTVIIKKYYQNQKDEIKLIKKNSKYSIVAKTRTQALKLAENNFDIALIDDGYQDYTYRKDVNIMCFTSKNPIGNGHTIPSGPLRERLSNLKKNHIILINGKKNKSFENKILKINKNIKIFYSNYLPAKNIRQFKKRKFLAFAGIGNPDNFFNLLKKNKINVVSKKVFPDHYDFQKKDINLLYAIAKKNKLKIITTEKDYLRLDKHSAIKINFLPVKLEINNEKKFIKEILTQLL